MKIHDYFFGIIDSVRKDDGSEYPENDVRTQYINRPGLIVLYDSEKRFPGETVMWIYFFKKDLDFPYFHTSFGILDPDIENLLITKNSVYHFTAKSTGLTSEQKEDLLINTGTVDTID